jgi:probable phosphoglycerate mutase
MPTIIRSTITRVFLVRHGETTLSADDCFAGSTDVPLADGGRMQAQRLAERLAGDTIAAAYCSPMQRTVETASIVARPHGLELRRRDGLREIDHGRWEGLRRADVESRWPDEYAAWEEDPYTFAPRGGESGVQVVARALPTMREIVSAHGGETVLVVSHKATIRLLMASLLGFDGRGYRDRLDQSPACLNVIEFKTPAHARLLLINDVSHYADMPALRSRSRMTA